MVSSRMPSMIERSPRAPALRSIALRAMAPSASSASVRSIDSISNSRWYCFTSAFFGSLRMRLRASSSRSSRVASTGSRPTNSGMRPYFSKSSGATSRKISPVPRSSGAITWAPKPIELDRPRAEMIFSSPVKAPPHTNRMGGVDLQELLLRMLAAAVRRHRRDGTFHDLEQSLLHALARAVAGDRRVVGLAADLVDLVDIDDAALGALDND